MSSNNGYKRMEIVDQGSCCEPRPRTAAGRPGSQVEEALARKLGGRLRLADARSIRAALSGSFEIAVVDRARRVRPRLRPAASGLPGGTPSVGDLGVLSLNARTSLASALQQLELLAKDSNCCATDPRHAAVDVVRSLLTDLSNALGPETGPNGPQVDALLSALLGEDLQDRRGDPVLEPDEVSGAMGRLREALRLTRKHAGSTESDKRITAYWAVVDQVERLWRSWSVRRDKLDPSFFAAQLPLLLQYFAAAADANERLLALLERAGQELHLLQVSFGANAETEPMSAYALIEWIRVVTTRQGPDNVRDHGPYGALAVQEPVRTLRDLTGRCELDWGARNCLDDDVAEGAQCALKEINVQLDSAAEIIDEVSVPSVCCVEDAVDERAAAPADPKPAPKRAKRKRSPKKTPKGPGTARGKSNKTGGRGGPLARTAAQRRRRTLRLATAATA